MLRELWCVELTFVLMNDLKVPQYLIRVLIMDMMVLQGDDEVADGDDDGVGVGAGVGDADAGLEIQGMPVLMEVLGPHIWID